MQPLRTRRIETSPRGDLALVRGVDAVSVRSLLIVSRCSKELQRSEEEISTGLLARLEQDEAVREGVLLPLGDHLCRRWCGALVRALLQWLEHGARDEELAIPTAVFALGRAAAEEDVSWASVGRAHQIQQGELTTRLAEAICPELGSDEIGEIAGWIAGVVSRFVLRASADAQTTYETQWSEARLTAQARRRRLVEAILAGGSIDEAEASLQLGYRLARTHWGLIVWSGEAAASGPGEIDVPLLTRVIREVAGSTPLVIARDREAWTWVAYSADREEADVLEAIAQRLPEDVRLAVGAPASGVDGFRVTHEEAVRARDISRLHVDPPRVARFGPDAMLDSLLMADVGAARSFVEGVLGKLAEPGQREQRHAIAVFLEHGSSFTAAARLLGLHHNTVAYRVRRAEETLGHPLGDHRLRTAAALRIADIILR
jgi:hypothetical protein